MDFRMVRNFDHAGYYETRLILTLIVLGLAIYRAARRNDSRYLIMFASGVFFQATMEMILQLMQLRGPNFQLSVYGVTLSGFAANLLQGCVEGGLIAVMSFWYFDLRKGKGDRPRRGAYLAMCGLIVAMACVVGWLSQGHMPTSARPMFSWSGALLLAVMILIGLVPALVAHGLGDMWTYYVGSLIYFVINFGPMQVMGARQIGIREASGELVVAGLGMQILVMAYSHLFEFAAYKLHYFTLPYCFGWLKRGSVRAPADDL